MHIATVLRALEQLPLATAVRGEEQWVWLFPIVETVHVLCLTLVVGSIAMVDLRLMGLSARGSAVSALSAELLPWTWSAFIGAVLTGSTLFISKAQAYFYNPQFEFKVLCLVLIGINMAMFHFGVYRRVVDWDRTLPPPRAARAAGAISITLWVCVVFLGRWAGWNT